MWLTIPTSKRVSPQLANITNDGKLLLIPHVLASRHKQNWQSFSCVFFLDCKEMNFWIASSNRKFSTSCIFCVTSSHRGRSVLLMYRTLLQQYYFVICGSLLLLLALQLWIFGFSWARNAITGLWIFHSSKYIFKSYAQDWKSFVNNYLQLCLFLNPFAWWN